MNQLVYLEFDLVRGHDMRQAHTPRHPHYRQGDRSTHTHTDDMIQILEKEAILKRQPNACQSQTDIDKREADMHRVPAVPYKLADP